MCISSFAFSHNAKNNNSAFLRPITNGKLSHSLSSTFGQQQQKVFSEQFSTSAFKPITPSSSTNLLIEASKLNKSTSLYKQFDQQKQLLQILNMHQQANQHPQSAHNRQNFHQEANQSSFISNFPRQSSFNGQCELVQQQKSFLLSDLSSLGTIGSNLSKKRNEKNSF